jgi:hypothetical protein
MNVTYVAKMTHEIETKIKSPNKKWRKDTKATYGQGN